MFGEISDAVLHERPACARDTKSLRAGTEAKFQIDTIDKELITKSTNFTKSIQGNQTA